MVPSLPAAATASAQPPAVAAPLLAAAAHLPTAAAPPPAAAVQPPAEVVEGPREPPVPSSPPRGLDRTVLPLSVRKVVLDPGHGGEQHGAVSDSGVSEKDITLDLAFRLRRLLEEAAFEVVMTRETDETLSLQQRVRIANTSQADLFVSIHVNWVSRREIRPLETYYAGPTDDPRALRLASDENRDSGYSLADYRRLLERVYLDRRREESHALAQQINSALYRVLSPVKPGLQNRGVKTAPFVVLIGTEMPTALVEVSSLSNADDVDLLADSEHRDRIASALHMGIRSYADRAHGPNRKGGRAWTP
jgi:N-acetylmuramoyl-L-alanine amidase